MFKFLVWHALLVAVSCELFNQELGYQNEYAPTYDNYQPRDYHFNYAVSDPHTGDHKSQWEVKEKGVVRGAYSLLEPDGTTRIVEYVADDHGFRAVVKKLGAAIHESPVAVQPIHDIAVPVEPVHVSLPEVSHYRTYDGQIHNYANLEVQPVLYGLQQNLGRGHETVLHQPQAVSLEHGQYLGRIEAKPQAVEQGQLLGRIHNQFQTELRTKVPVAQSYSNAAHSQIELGGLRQALPLDLGAQNEFSQGGIETVPQYATQTGQSDRIVQEQHVTKIESNLGQYPKFQAAFETVPQIETHGIRSGLSVGQSYGGGQYLGNLGRVEAVPQIETHGIESSLSAGQAYDSGQYLGRVEAVPQYEAHGVRSSLSAGQAYGGGVDQGQYLGAIGANLGRAEVVPETQSHGLRPGLSVSHIYGSGALQGQYLGSYGSNLGRVEVVPQIETHGAGPVNHVYGSGASQGQYYGGIEADLGRVEAVPQFETHGLRSGPVAQSYGGGGSQGQYSGGRSGEVPGYLARSEIDSNRHAQVPGLVPVSPSYRTTIEYHGLTGNPDDDSAYTRDEYHSSASERVPKVVLAPHSKDHGDHKKESPVKEQFLIYIPEGESH